MTDISYRRSTNIRSSHTKSNCHDDLKELWVVVQNYICMLTLWINQTLIHQQQLSNRFH